MEKKKSKQVLLTVMGVLIILEIVERLIIIDTFTVGGVLQLVSLLFTALYGFRLYKKPHGNMLKYAMLIFAFVNILSGSYYILLKRPHNIGKLLASAGLCYCAGRLNRIEQNKIIMPILGLTYLVVSVVAARTQYSYQPENILSVISSFNFTINYLTLMIAYFVRFEEHKLAGLMDSPKK